jgi:hypothetical protein
MSDKSLAVFKNIEMSVSSTKLNTNDIYILLTKEQYYIKLEKAKYNLMKDNFK